MSLRERILEAAASALRELGPTNATTKVIARTGGFSEGSLYNHFADKESLFRELQAERIAAFAAVIGGLHGKVGEGTIAGHLEELVEAAVPFYREMEPISQAAYPTPASHEALVGELRDRSIGPHRAGDALAAYLQREQAAGRLRAGADMEAAAVLLLGACRQRVLFTHFSGEEDSAEETRAFGRAVVATLLDGIGKSEE